MKEGKILVYCFLMCVATGVTVYMLTEREHKKVGVIDAVKLFDQFHMKKEMEAKEKVKLEGIKKQLDSVESLVRIAQASKNEEEVKKQAYAYGYFKAQLEKQFKQGNQEINEQVWKRLNPMMDEYGKSKGLHLIIGANGMGSVLYNDEHFDLTPDAIKYVNKKYEEGN